MLHAGLALELSRVIRNERLAEAGAGRGPSGHLSPRRRTRRWWARPPEGRVLSAPRIGAEEPWTVWRAVEPDPEYLRRRAA
ncbi:MAG TPA: hypothetical protein VNP90_06625 [Actinomycetota bacterium]|nr:hypothetical protein [Actinomycetota bacterium]